MGIGCAKVYQWTHGKPPRQLKRRASPDGGGGDARTAGPGVPRRAVRAARRRTNRKCRVPRKGFETASKHERGPRTSVIAMARAIHKLGCWVDFFGKTQLRGDLRRVKGPQAIMLEIGEKAPPIASAIIGPAARLRIVVRRRATEEAIELHSGVVATDLTAALARRAVRRIEIEYVSVARTRKRK
jgi:hypothetical protein